MLRISQPKHTDPRELIISVRVAKDTCPSSIRHIIVRRQKFPQGEVKYLAVEALGFDSVDDLLQHYTKQKTPINPQVKTSVLLKAVERQPWEFHHEEIRLKKLLGAGAFGEVRAGEVTIKGKKVECAIKLAKVVKDEAQLIHAKEKIKELMHEARLMRHYDHDNVVRIYGVAVDREPLMILIELAKVVKDEAQLIHAKEKIKELMHEARLMRHYDHDNVVRIYGVAVDREPLMILIELVKGGSVLSDLRKRRGTVSDEEKLNNMTLGTAKGLAYLHSKGCIHRDIAARNVLYTKDKIAKISDFGMSREGGVYRMRHGKKVPIKWTAPETITTFIYSLKTDVFSFSIFMWEVFSDGMDPYKGITNTAVKKMVVRELECIIKKEAESRKKYPSTALKGSKQERPVKQSNEPSDREEKENPTVSSWKTGKSCML
uniref:non-specific protein-tyrosine kinase n=1 Tax=Ascaris lumbricoides TaxID=6252 RepID=A0A0M3IRK3_ASCLU